MNKQYLAYWKNLQERDLEHITTIVIHCTELPDMQIAREFGEKIHYPQSHTGNSGHIYIDREGCAELWVPLTRIAHHTRGYNAESVGIELMNLGRYPDWFHSQRQIPTQSYPASQITALITVVRDLQQSLPNLAHIEGHEYLDTETVPSSDSPGIMVKRKSDPGPLFPWDDLMAEITLERMAR